MADKTLSLNQNVERLKRYAFMEQAVMRTLAGWLPGVPEWEAKNEIGLHIWEDADACERLREAMMTLPAVEQYALLTTVIEPNGMPEKRRNIEHFEMIRDDVAAQAVTYDWSDENNPIRWGKKWTPVLLETYGYHETPEQIADRTEQWLLVNTPVKMQVRMAQEGGAALG